MSSAITTCEHPNPLQRGDGVLSSHEGDQGSKKDGQLKSPSSSHLAYGILDIPPWYLCIFLGIQHFLTALGGLVAVPLILAKDLCLQHDPLTQSYLISTIFFVSGICTLLQVLLGIRLPILQGGTFAFLGPSLAMLSLPTWKCPAWTLNASQVNTSSPEFIEEWQKRIRELQGAVMVASCVQMLVGFSGLIGFLMRFIGPLTIAPTISLMALPLFDSAGDDAGIHWGIAATTIFLIVLFSQYLKNIAVPVPVYGREKKSHASKFYLFQIFPVLLGLCISWLLCFVLTVSDALPSAPTAYGYLARTDTKGNVLSQAPWFRFPYPGQWGLPTVSLAGVFGIIAAVISSMVESIGDYHACARLVGAPPPPKHAINRGIGIEGLGCLLAGAWGTGNGTTSYSENVGALGITRCRGVVFPRTSEVSFGEYRARYSFPSLHFLIAPSDLPTSVSARPRAHRGSSNAWAAAEPAPSPAATDTVDAWVLSQSFQTLVQVKGMFFHVRTTDPHRNITGMGYMSKKQQLFFLLKEANIMQNRKLYSINGTKFF
ncbi:solute carrier family 23 member 2 isoform X3 [Bubalus bubalis]|uniref:solute carrier family 23 member 2 isoform X3 n=1 Tax=Bubalus bubalis TaxID=89462 RepID=UPI001D108881|nr:solute carrier family 23 member 2 isoform X3 [Bubalus bubalis]